MGKHTDTNSKGNTEVPKREAKLSTASVASCRICYDNEKGEELMTPCYCKGSVAFVHRSCLETWLLESGMDRCEICHQLYRTDKEEPSRIQRFWDWLKNSSRSPEHTVRVHIMACTVITPLAIILVTYIFCMYYSHQAATSTTPEGYETSKDQATNLLTVLGIILIGYYLWVYSVTRIHARWQRSCIIRYIPRNLPNDEPEIVIGTILNIHNRVDQNQPVSNAPLPQPDFDDTNSEHTEEREVLLNQIYDTEGQRDDASLTTSCVSHIPPDFAYSDQIKKPLQIEAKHTNTVVDKNITFENRGLGYKPRMIYDDNIVLKIPSISRHLIFGPYIIDLHKAIYEIKYQKQKTSHYQTGEINNKTTLKSFKPNQRRPSYGIPKIKKYLCKNYVNKKSTCADKIEQPKDIRGKKFRIYIRMLIINQKLKNVGQI